MNDDTENYLMHEEMNPRPNNKECPFCRDSEDIPIELDEYGVCPNCGYGE